MNQWTLRQQITFMVGLIMTLACIALTVNSIYSARAYYGWVDNFQKEQMAQKAEYLPIVFPDYMPIDLFTTQGIIAMLLIICISVLFTYWVTGRLLRPVTELASSIEDIGAHNLHQRVELSRTTGEVIVLTNSFNKMLDRLDNSFTIQKNFAANAAHELKTPLAAIKTSLQVLEMDDVPEIEDYKIFVQRTSKSLNRLILTVEGLVSLTNEFAQHEETPLFLEDIVKQASQELSQLAIDKQVEITIIGDTGKINGNRALLHRAFYNLIENAIKYNHQGGSVDIILGFENGNSTVEITDSGLGISEQALDHIFEPFYREEPSRSQAIPGSGLGMALVKLIMEKHHGTIHVESEKGHGTKVFVKLSEKFF